MQGESKRRDDRFDEEEGGNLSTICRCCTEFRKQTRVGDLVVDTAGGKEAEGV